MQNILLDDDVMTGIGPSNQIDKEAELLRRLEAVEKAVHDVNEACNSPQGSVRCVTWRAALVHLR